MNAIKAIFTKQLNDVFKNPTVTMMFIMFPAMAFVMVEFISDGTVSAFQQILSMAVMSIGSMPLVAIASYIAEDVEHRSLRFLVMAGVKPTQYLSGLAIFVLILSMAAMLIFGFIGRLSGADFGLFMGISLIGCLASLILGAVVGIFSKNVQQANTYATVLMMLIGFTPMFGLFNPEMIRYTYFLFTQQIWLILMYIAQGGGEYALGLFADLDVHFEVMHSILIILGNIVVLTGLFAFVYKKKGLKGE